jgi:cobalamin biosynthesis protein CbiG
MNSASMRETLERLVDRHTAAALLMELGEVCRAKAEHIRANWQDPPAAIPWEKLGRAVHLAADAAARRNL